MTHCKAQWYHTLHVSATSHRCCDLARDPHSQTLTITVGVKCPVLNTAWAQGLMVQSKILVLPPMRAGNSDGSGDLPAHSALLALPQPKAAPKSLLNKPTSAFVLSLVLQKSALVFQATLATLWCFGTVPAEQRLLHPVLNQGVHCTGKMLFCINSLLEPSHVSLQSFSGTDTCHVFPHSKNRTNNKEKLRAGWHRSQISDSEAFIHSWGKLLLFFQHCVK